MSTIKSGVDSFSSPDEFLGGCGTQKSRAPRRSLRASWIQPAGGEELSVESLGLNSSKQGLGLNALLERDNASLQKHNVPMHDETERTANSSSGDFEYHDDHHDGDGDHMNVDEKVVEEAAEEAAAEVVKEKRNSSMAYALDDFLPGSEPKPIKKWTPPKKEDAKSTHMAGAYAQDSFLPGCEPKPIKKWTPPPKEPQSEESSSGRRSSLYDNQTDFIGGCDPKPIRRWSKPKVVDDDDNDDGPTTRRRSSLYDNQTDFIGGCDPKPIRRWSKPNADASAAH